MIYIKDCHFSEKLISTPQQSQRNNIEKAITIAVWLPTAFVTRDDNFSKKCNREYLCKASKIIKI